MSLWSAKRRQIAGWAAVSISTLVACFWAFWGSNENFHEGWFSPSVWQNIGLMFAQYLSPMLIVMLISILALAWPRLALPLFGASAVAVAWFFRGSPRSNCPYRHSVVDAGNALSLWPSRTSSLGVEILNRSSPYYDGCLWSISLLASNSSSGRRQLRNAADRRQWGHSYLGAGGAGVALPRSIVARSESNLRVLERGRPHSR